MFFHLSREGGAGFTVRMEPGCQDLVRFDIGPDERVEFLGDPVMRDRIALPQSIMGADGHVDAGKLFDQVPGHYYWFHWRGDALECGSSFCGMLPLYFRNADGRSDISSSSFHLARTHHLVADDRGYLLERRLFNYPLFDRTPWKSIRLLPAHSKLIAEGGMLKVERCFSIEEHFGDGAGSSAKDMEALCDVFQRECDVLIPASGFALSFTGGFDGRTLLGAALKLGRTGFSTYGFGLPGESDIALPEKQARELDVPYSPILLDDRYVREDALASAIAFMDLSDHAGNLGRPHYHYAARLLSRAHTHLVTGNFGSELFRALHAPGALMTANLIRIFSDVDGGWREVLLREAGEGFAPEAGELVAEIGTYLASASSLPPSQRFYRFVFDELFRKYFGPEIVVQNEFLRNRTPFLSLRFVKALHRTVWAGVHSRLFETDKIRRVKGQVFYAEYLRHAHPRLYRMPTNKGYAPPDVVERWRLPLLVAKFAWKRFAEPELVDSNSIGAFDRLHHDALLDHYGLVREGQEDLQALSNEVSWAAAKALTGTLGSSDAGAQGGKPV
jgi:hypothetical protein